jgi:hypothetical protein
VERTHTHWFSILLPPLVERRQLEPLRRGIGTLAERLGLSQYHRRPRVGSVSPGWLRAHEAESGKRGVD